MATFADICPPSELSRLFKVSKYYPTTFITGTGATQNFDGTKWSNVTEADAFPGVIENNSLTVDTYRPMSITKTAVMSSASSNVNIKIFSVLKLLINLSGKGQAERYRLPDSGAYTNRSITPIADLQSSFYNSLKTTVIPGSTATNIPGSPQTDNYIIKDMKFEGSTIRYSITLDFLYSLKYEYCYWASLLKVLIGNLFSVFSNTSFANADAKNAVILKFINAAVSVNYRLNDLSDIMTYISGQQKTELSTTIGEVNTATAKIANSQTSINQAVNALSKTDGLSKLRSRMVEYNEEKNNYASALLSLYGFANLVAIGLLFYIYKS